MPVKTTIQNSVYQTEEKVSRNYVKTSSGYYQYGVSDLSSYYFLSALAPYLADTYDNSDLNYSSNNMVSNFVIQTSGVYKIFFYDTTDNEYDLAFSVSNFVVNKSLVDTLSDTRPVYNYKFTFGNSSPYDKQLTLSWLSQRTINNQLTIWGFELLVSDALTTQFGSVENWYPCVMLDELIGGYGAFIGTLFYSIQGDPYNLGREEGYQNGYSNAEWDIYQNNDNPIHIRIYNQGKQDGRAEGISYGQEQSGTALTIFTGIVDVGLLPVNVFLQMFEYEVFGINIAGLISGLLTICVAIIIVRFITGKKE